MAERIAFIVKRDNSNNNYYVKKEYIEFIWHKGLSISQKQKSINELHNQILKHDSNLKILEISSKSNNIIGKSLSAFNLCFKNNGTGEILSVENAFQGSKVFNYGGPYIDLYKKTPIEAKKDERIKKSGELKYFLYNNEKWEITPKTLFYDWLYLNALIQNKSILDQLLKFNCFTDIEFNHHKSINCQAFTCALCVAIYKSNELNKIKLHKEEYIKFIMRYYKYCPDNLNNPIQMHLI